MALIKNGEWESDVVKAARENHMWLNAFRCVRPTEEFCAEVGRSIIEMLNDPENLIRPEVALIDSEREMVIRINKS